MISEALRQQLLQFRRERDWEQFHDLRTLSVSIALEAAELMEFTQWAKDQDVSSIATRERQRIGEEVADVAILLTYLIHDLGLDLETEVRRKLEVNARKYPVELAKGRSHKYDRLGDPE